MWNIHVHRIEGFSDTSGFMDKTDPFVKIIVGSQNKRVFKTQEKINAGGHATFDETFTFEQVSELLPAEEHLITIQVWDKDLLSDDFMGQSEINMRDKQALTLSAVDIMTRSGELAGKVIVSLYLGPEESKLVSEEERKTREMQIWKQQQAEAARQRLAGE
jgi:hypothetical protein